MTTPFGTPFQQIGSRSETSTLILEPTLGLNVGQSPLNLQEGATPNCENFIMRDGRLEPRSVLSQLGTTGAIPAGFEAYDALVGGIAANKTDDSRYLLVAGRETRWAYQEPGRTTWPTVGYTPLYGLSDYWDFTQIYSDIHDENMIVGGITSRGTILPYWVVGSSNISTLTGSPGARFVAAFDNYLVAANTGESGTAYPQRVRWSDRGSASSWTGGTSGFEDLLGAKGGITRIVPLENRLIVFFEDEIWQGVRVDFPGILSFSALDTSVGCPFSWTVTPTPQGILFMARNYQTYLLPKDGGGAQPIGQRIHKTIRDSIKYPSKAFGVYDGVNNFYHFYFNSGNSGNLPNRALWLHLDTGAWAPQSFATNKIVLTRGFTAPISLSMASSWDDLSNLGVTWDALTESWDDLMGVGNERQAVVMLSTRTVYEYSSILTRDNNSEIPTAYWQSKPLESGAPFAQKALLQVRTEYTATSNSSLTVRTSPSQGAAFDTGSLVTLATASQVSQMPAYVQQPARYPVFRVEASGQTGYALHRFYADMRIGGR